MQHPDDGQIHAWLDGALPPDEASSLEVHVVACAECAAKVAEARGLVAGASRILSALDNIPRVTAPVAMRRRYNSRLLQAAAILIVVAGGGALITRTRAADSTSQSPKPAVTFDDRREVPAAAVEPMRAPETAPERRVASNPAARQRDQQAPVPSMSVSQVSDASVSSPALMAKTQIANVDASAQAAAPPMVASTAAAPLTILRTEWSALEVRTHYQVAPNRVVVLIEFGAPAQSAVVTGAVTQSASAVLRSRILGGSVGTTANLAPQAVAPSDTLKWQDETGKPVLLVGPFSTSELAELKKRILELRTKR